MPYGADLPHGATAPYNTKGIHALCEGLRASALTAFDLTHNDIPAEAATELASVVVQHTALTHFGPIPLTRLRADEVTDLDLALKGLGLAETIVLSRISSGALRKLSLQHNRIGCWGVTALGEVLNTTHIKELNLADCKICGLSRCGKTKYKLEGIYKLCEGLRGSCVTSLK